MFSFRFIHFIFYLTDIFSTSGDEETNTNQENDKLLGANSGIQPQKIVNVRFYKPARRQTNAQLSNFNNENDEIVMSRTETQECSWSTNLRKIEKSHVTNPSTVVNMIAHEDNEAESSGKVSYTLLQPCEGVVGNNATGSSAISTNHAKHIEENESSMPAEDTQEDTCVIRRRHKPIVSRPKQILYSDSDSDFEECMFKMGICSGVLGFFILAGSLVGLMVFLCPLNRYLISRYLM